MTEAPKVGSSIVVGLIMFGAVSAWVAAEAMSNLPSVPVFEREVQRTTSMIPVSDSLLPQEEVVSVAPPAPVVPAAPQRVVEVAAPTAPAEAPKASARRVARTPAPAAAPPARRPTTTRTTVVVEGRRTADQRIQREVMDRLAANTRLDGHISVQSKQAVVRLSGWTRTTGQAREAEREARSVRDVRYVENEIRPRVGGSL